MKFSQISYKRPDMAAVKAELSGYTERLTRAESYAEAREVFLLTDELIKHVDTMCILSEIRYSINTSDSFYAAEEEFWSNAEPELQEYISLWNKALLEGRFRADFEKEYGGLMFIDLELEQKSFSPEIILELQQENELVMEYQKLIAGAKVSFEGEEYTLAQMMPFKICADDDKRRAAWLADGLWFKENGAELDRIFDALVRLRTAMGRRLGFSDFTQLGYCRMRRNCYDKHDIEKFREAVLKYLVPVADEVYRQKAERLSLPYPLSYADKELEFRSGNAKPKGGEADILEAAKKFYDALSPESSAFFREMLAHELLDLKAKKNKQAGGYCTQLWDQRLPFIFANFNGSSDDVETVTHEAGHAFSYYINRDRIPHSYCWPSMEACEVHSMSMEFFAESAAEDFYGKDAAKFLYSHVTGSLCFIPYGTAVDHFQHIIYEKPELTVSERHEVWRELSKTYMPWLRLDGEIPFWSEGRAWQKQIHIYEDPFYYIDYCLAQTVALEFWALLQADRERAWEKYMAYTRLGGSLSFKELLSVAELESPFDEHCLKAVCGQAHEFIKNYNLKGIE